MHEVGFRLCPKCFSNVSADRCARSKDLLWQNVFFVFSNMSCLYNVMIIRVKANAFSAITFSLAIETLPLYKPCNGLTSSNSCRESTFIVNFQFSILNWLEFSIFNSQFVSAAPPRRLGAIDFHAMYWRKLVSEEGVENVQQTENGKSPSCPFVEGRTGCFACDRWWSPRVEDWLCHLFSILLLVVFISSAIKGTGDMMSMKISLFVWRGGDGGGGSGCDSIENWQLRIENWELR